MILKRALAKSRQVGRLHYPNKDSSQHLYFEKLLVSQSVNHVSVTMRRSRSLLRMERYSFSTSAAAPGTSSSTATTGAAAGTQATKPKDNSNIFLDNLGKIFLAIIATIIGTLIRSSYNTTNRNAVRDHLEDVAALDPVEIDELRIANSDLTPEVFRIIINSLKDQYSTTGTCSYREFIQSVRRNMTQQKGEGFTIQLGHYLDRVVVRILENYSNNNNNNNNNNDSSSPASPDDPLPLTLWFSVLSLALNSSVPDRIRILYEIMESKEQPVKFSQIVEMVGDLQQTCQLPPDAQIVPTETKYPTQQWKQGNAKDLVPWEGSDRDVIDVDTFATILRSKSVCAWGECYYKRKFDGVDS